VPPEASLLWYGIQGDDRAGSVFIPLQLLG